MDNTDYESMKMMELRDLCTARGLSTTGRKKQDLIDRLRPHGAPGGIVQSLQEDQQQQMQQVQQEQQEQQHEQQHQSPVPGPSPSGIVAQQAAVAAAMAAAADLSRKRPMDSTAGAVRKRISIGATDAPPGTAPAAASDSSMLKMLVNNNEAGFVIGKRGSVVNELQATTGCEVKLSQHGMVFPGTSMRVLLMRGTLTQVSAALTAIQQKRAESAVQQAARTQQSTGEEPPPMQTVLLVPILMGGCIIGHKGDNITRLQAESQARIQLAKKESTISGTNERMVTVTGGLEEQLNACLMILGQFQTVEGEAGTYQNQSTQYTQSAGGYQQRDAYGASGYGASPGAPATTGGPRTDADGSSVLEISVPDSYIGGVVGKGGSVITSIQETTGARVQISQKNVFVPGTNRRIITIKGTPTQCDAARSMITKIVEEQTQNDPYSGGGGRGGGYQQPQQQQPAYGGDQYGQQYQSPQQQQPYGGGASGYYQQPQYAPQGAASSGGRYGAVGSGAPGGGGYRGGYAAPQQTASPGYQQPPVQQYGAAPVSGAVQQYSAGAGQQQWK